MIELEQKSESGVAFFLFLFFSLNNFIAFQVWIFIKTFQQPKAKVPESLLWEVNLINFIVKKVIYIFTHQDTLTKIQGPCLCPIQF